MSSGSGVGKNLMPHGLDVLLQCAELCLKSDTACRALEGAVPSAPLPSLDGASKSKAGYASWESIDRRFLTKVQERQTFATFLYSFCFYLQVSLSMHFCLRCSMLSFVSGRGLCYLWVFAWLRLPECRGHIFCWLARSRHLK